tara:strand:+ start:78 stop:917 length:840 start_codon:yes stop_codon:yes gene_type:complete
MKTVTSISGGKTSAYLAANYHSDYLVFSLVRTLDDRVKFKDREIAKIVSDKINDDFVGTLEDDKIIYTILDLEQYLGKNINWVSGITFDEVINGKYGGWLPSKLRRYCTTELKVRPIFHWWHENIGEPVIMNIGYRASENSRAERMREKLNKNGLQEFKATFEKGKTGRNKWVTIEWRKPNFPLIDDFLFKQDIENFWKDKPVRFAQYNNCMGCFHRSAALLKELSVTNKKQFDWFARAEKIGKGTWKQDVSYDKIDKLNFTQKLDFDSEGCNSGFCGF